MTKFIIRLTALLLGLLVFSSAFAHLHPGDRPPDFLGKTPDGQAITLSSLHGDVVIVTFWATWCHYCRQELPILSGIQKVATKKGLHMQVVAVDYREDLHIFAKSAQLMHLHLPNMIFTWDSNGDIGRPYQVAKGIPVLILFHRNGTIAYIHDGYSKRELDELVREINTLLSEPMPAAQKTAGL